MAIHMAHRLFAVLAASGAAGAGRMCCGTGSPSGGAALVLLALSLLQLASGLSNVVLGWPLVAALAHTGGAAALVAVLTLRCWRAAARPRRRRP